MTNPRKSAPKKRPSARVTVPRPDTSTSAQNPLVFISHDSRDSELAEAFSKLLSSVSAGMLKSFRSSDRKGTEGIEYGVEWYPEVMSKIELASDVVCLLTPRSLERPWILYEAGVAKGKLDTPVHGLALGVPLSKAATGPFAQFQNLDDDAASLQKLVLQLMKRVPNAEPDTDTVGMQIKAFKDKATSVLEEIRKQSTAGQKEHSTVEESSVAKLFEEVKVMFQDLPSRIDSRVSQASAARLRRFHPEMVREIRHFNSTESPGLEVLILCSLVREQAPWIYELGVETFRAMRSRDSSAHNLLIELRTSLDFVMHHPIYRTNPENRELNYVVRREIERIAAKHVDSPSAPVTPAKKKFRAL